MLADFMNNKDTQPDTEEAIRIMTDALNMIGPPTRTSAQWRRTWSILKYNNKKRKRHGVVDASEILKRTRLGVCQSIYLKSCAVLIYSPSCKLFQIITTMRMRQIRPAQRPMIPTKKTFPISQILSIRTF